MSHYPHSPYNRVRLMVEEFQQERLSLEQFQEQLAALLDQLERWHTQMEEIHAGGDDEEGQERLAYAKEALQVSYDGVELLRESPGSAQGLSLLAEASDCLAKIQHITAENVQNLLNDE